MVNQFGKLIFFFNITIQGDCLFMVQKIFLKQNFLEAFKMMVFTSKHL